MKVPDKSNFFGENLETMLIGLPGASPGSIHSSSKMKTADTALGSTTAGTA